MLYGLLDVALAFEKVSEMTKDEAEEWLQDKHVGDWEYFEIKSADVYLKTLKDTLLTNKNAPKVVIVDKKANGNNLKDEL